MPKFYVRKEGRVHNIFTTPFTDWNTPPEGEFPNTVLADNSAALEAQIGKDYVIVDKPQENAKAAPRLPLGALLGALAGMGIPQEKIAQIHKVKSELDDADSHSQIKEAVNNQRSELAHAGNTNMNLERLHNDLEYQDKILQEFRVVVAVGNKEEIEHVGSFILAVCPDLEVELRNITSPKTKKRFTI
jgi:hypothetical protein